MRNIASEAIANFERARMLFRAGKYAGALRLLTELDTEFPNTVNILYAMAACYERLECFGEVEKIYDRLMVLAPDARLTELKARLSARRDTGGTDLSDNLISSRKESLQTHIDTSARTYGWRRLLIAAFCAIVVVTVFRLIQSPVTVFSTTSGTQKEIQEEYLGRQSGKMVENSFRLSRSNEGCSVAWVEATGNKNFAVVDGKAGPKYDSIEHFNLCPGGKRFAYVAKEAGKDFVVVDGKAELKYDKIWQIVFSRDSKHIAYSVRRGGIKENVGRDGKPMGYTLLEGGKEFMVVDGKPSPEYDRIGDMLLSDDGKRAACIATMGDKESVIVDGNPGPMFDTIGYMEFSKDGKHLAYTAVKAYAKPIREHGVCSPGIEHHLVVFDGVPGPEYDGIGLMTFIPDGMRLAYVAKKNGKEFMVVDGKAGPEYDSIDYIDMRSENTHLLYKASKNGERFIVLDEQATPGYDKVGEYKISPDGKSLTYAAEKDKKWFIVSDGQMGQEYDGIGCLVASPDGKHLAYTAKKGEKWFAVVDGQAGQEYDKIDWLVTSPDGGRVAYNARKNSQLFLTVDDKTHPVGDALDVVSFANISTDFSHATYVVRRGDKIAVMVDEKAGPEYDEILCGPVFLKDGRVEYIGKKSSDLYRVQHRP